MITSAQMIGSLVVRRDIDHSHLRLLMLYASTRGNPIGTPFCADQFGRRATLVVGAVQMLGGCGATSDCMDGQAYLLQSRLLGEANGSWSRSTFSRSLMRYLPLAGAGLAYLAPMPRHC
jgi:hypothetical protein